MEFVLGINQRPNCSTTPHVGHSDGKNRKTINALGTVSNITEYREKNSHGVAAFKDKNYI